MPIGQFLRLLGRALYLFDTLLTDALKDGYNYYDAN